MIKRKTLALGRIASLTAIGLIGSGCYLLYDRDSLTLKPSGSMNCVAVEFPAEQWQAGVEDEAEFRLSRTQPPEIVVVTRAHQYSGSGSLYTSYKYAFRPGNPAARIADEGLWRNADELKGGAKRTPEWSDEFYRTDATLRGKSFRRTGQFAYGSDVSEKGQWIAAYSYDGRADPKEGEGQGRHGVAQPRSRSLKGYSLH